MDPRAGLGRVNAVRPFLLVAPYFAPQAAVGAYRWIKLARRLPPLGFRPIVLSATFPEDRRDEALLATLPPEVRIVEEYLDPVLLALRARLDRLRGAAAEPDRPIQGLRPFRSLGDRCAPHVLHAAAAAVRLARRARAEAVVVSAGPFSAVPVGFHVRRALRLPLVLDFRDPWALHESGAEPVAGLADRARRAAVTALERRWMERADHVVLNTRRALEAYRARYPTLAGKSSFVRNCFDLDLYTPPDPSAAPPSRFTIVHVGTLRADTTVDDIGAALRRLIDRERLAPGAIVLRQIGRMTAFERRRFDELGLAPFVETAPPVALRDVLSELRRAHVLLAMFDRGVALRIAAKTYDYVASGMPIVSITENEEVDELLAHRRDNARVRSGDVAGLTDVLARHLARFRATGALPEPAPPPAALSSAAAAARFATILEDVTRRR